jgi:hypothetical protein
MRYSFGLYQTDDQEVNHPKKMFDSYDVYNHGIIITTNKTSTAKIAHGLDGCEMSRVNGTGAYQFDRVAWASVPEAFTLTPELSMARQLMGRVTFKVAADSRL